MQRSSDITMIHSSCAHHHTPLSLLHLLTNVFVWLAFSFDTEKVLASSSSKGGKFNQHSNGSHIHHSQVEWHNFPDELSTLVCMQGTHCSCLHILALLGSYFVLSWK